MDTKASLEILSQTIEDGTYFQETDLSHMQNVGHGQSYATMMSREEKHQSDMFQARNGGRSAVGKLKPLNLITASQGIDDFSHKAVIGRTRDGMKIHLVFDESFCFLYRQKTQTLLTDICPDSKSYFEKKKASKSYQSLNKKRSH